MSNQAVVIDCGSYMCKAGFGEDEAPISVFNSVIAKNKGASNPKKGIDILVGDLAASTVKPSFCKIYPLSDGLFSDMDLCEEFYHHLFYNELKIDPSEHTTLLSEPINSNPQYREKIAQVMFETFNIPTLSIENQCFLSLLSVGLKKGIVCDIGHVHAQILPTGIDLGNIYNASNSIPLGGEVITDLLSKDEHFQMQDKLITYWPKKKSDLPRDMKERACYITLNYKEDMIKAKSSSDVDYSYTFPDGNCVTFAEERFKYTEAFFNPSLFGFAYKSIPQLIYDSIQKCQKDVQSQLFESIALAGGSTLFEGFPERLQIEMNKLAGPGNTIKIIANPERKYNCWIGGSILSCLETFQSRCLQLAKYKEEGASSVRLFK